MMSRLARLVILIAALYGLAPAVAAEDYVQITGERVNIRFGPSTVSRVVAQARRGDVFGLRQVLDDWYKVNLFSGQHRYVHRSLARVVDYSPVLPEERVRYQVYLAIGNAELRSTKAADAEYPSRDHLERRILGNEIRNTELKRILRDRYILQIFHDYGINPALRGPILGEGLTKGWFN